MSLPPFIILRANDDRYVLLNVSHVTRFIDNVEKTCLKFDVVNEPQNMLNGRWKTARVESSALNYTCERVSSRGPTKYYNTLMHKMPNYIELSWGSVHEYNMTSPNQILSSKFYRVVMNEDRNVKWHFKKASLLTQPQQNQPLHQQVQPMNNQTKIPNHIFRVYLQDAITRNEVCPITMEPLTMNAGLTNCGHLFNKDALLMATRGSPNCSLCPICRAPVREQDIQILA